MVCVQPSLNNHVEIHIMAIFQDDNVKTHQAQIVKEWLGGSPDLTLIECLWDVLE